MNDPKLFYHKGQYHVFFQHNPEFAGWGNMHWGHTMSRDLVHWKHLPIALAPEPGTPDAQGCWTGCVVSEDNWFHILYTAIPQRDPLIQVQSLATSKDLITWEKYSGNPVISEKPEGFGPCFRDPCAWKEGDTWYMIIGSDVPGEGGAALLYRSSDLVNWTYLHPLFVGKTEETGHEFECPDFFPLGDKHVLLTSSGKTHWHLGTYKDHKFTRESRGVTDSGNYYAAKTLVDERGWRIIWGWVQEARPETEQREAGWSGVLSLPRRLTLHSDGGLGIEPVPELQALRGHHRRFLNVSLVDEGDESVLLLPDVQGDALELIVKFASNQAKAFGVYARCSPDLKERAEIVYDAEKKRLGNAPLELKEDEDLTLRVFIDRSVIESFANGRACHTQRTYPRGKDCLGVGLFARGGEAKIKSVDVWEMKTI